MGVIEEKLKRMKREAEERQVAYLALTHNFNYQDPKDLIIKTEIKNIFEKNRESFTHALPLQFADNRLVCAIKNPSDWQAVSIPTHILPLGAPPTAVLVSTTTFTELKNQLSDEPNGGSEEKSESETHNEEKPVLLPDTLLPASKETPSEGELEKEKEYEFNPKNLFASIKSLFDLRDFFAREKNVISITDLVGILLVSGVSLGASGIHLEAGRDAFKVRYRLDGRLLDALDNLEYNYHNLVTRIKLLGGLKIDITARPQDGHFSFNIGDRAVDFRVSSIPTELGENIVLRILDPQSIKVSLNDLGLRPDDLIIIKKYIKAPNGLIALTGPTGSGKTTTLYSFLEERKTDSVKIITIEDPIEYHVGGIEQTEVNISSGYTFASGLSAILRQDPDIIFVGEIRDNKTADIALQAALTGHLVFTTVHANDAAGAIPRFINLGAIPLVLGPALRIIIAERLLRRLCPYCKKEQVLSPEFLAQLQSLIKGLPSRVIRSHDSPFSVFEPVGCDKCNGEGFKGRIGIFELIERTPDLESAIERGAGESELRIIAKKNSFVSMQEDGLLKVLSGITSLSELELTTGPLSLE